MRRTVLAFVMSCLAALVVAGVAQAAIVDDAGAALKQSPIFVAPGTEGITSETANELQGHLRGGDNIVIVMLPADALNGYDGGTPAYLQKLDKSTGGSKRIIALAVGDQTVGYSTLLPSGVAPDLMNRASSVSVNKTETLTTFVRNVHAWQALNPAAPASKPAVKKKQGGNGLLLATIAIAAVLLGVLALALQRHSYNLSEDQIKFRSPELVKNRLERIMQQRELINDDSLRGLLLQICRDTEEYFRRNTNKVDADAAAFERHFAAIEKVLDKYVDVQNNPRYFDEPVRLTRRGHGAVADFGEFVLNSVRRGTRQELIDYNVDTDILSAQKHSA